MRADDMIREIDPSVELTVTDLTFAPKTTCLRTKNVGDFTINDLLLLKDYEVCSLTLTQKGQIWLKVAKRDEED